MLFLGLYTSPGGPLLLDATPYARGLRFSMNKSGYKDLSCYLDISADIAVRLWDYNIPLHVVVRDNGLTVWEGRVEDPTLDISEAGSGYSFAAFGYQRAFWDAPYTAFWTTGRFDSFAVVPVTITNMNPSMYQLENDGRLFFGLQKNAVYANNADTGAFVFQIGDDGTNTLKYISFDYAYVLPAVHRRLRVSIMPADRSSSTSYDTTVTGTGSGSFSQDMSAAANYRVEIQFYNISGAPTTYLGESGANYLVITNLRLTASDSTVYADDVMDDLVSKINTLNSNQLQNVVGQFGSPALDLVDENYEDQYPGDILNTLVAKGDDQTPPRVWEWGVEDDRIPYLRARASQAFIWCADIAQFRVNRTLDEMHNSAYAVYQDTAGVPVRTSINADSDMVARYGLTRRSAVPAQTTDATEAGVTRDMFLNDRKNPRPLAEIVLGHGTQIYDQAGNTFPKYFVKAAHQINLRNLPPTFTTDIDRIKSYYIAEIEYDADSDALTIIPEAPPRTLDVMVARAG